MFLAKGKGCRVWDVDGNEYIDYIQGLLPNILGYAHEGVNAAVAEQLGQGHSFSLPHPLEVELAERLSGLFLARRKYALARMDRMRLRARFAQRAHLRAASALLAAATTAGRIGISAAPTRNAGVPEAVRP